MEDVTDVQNYVQFKKEYQSFVQEIAHNRKESHSSQSDTADWIGVDRRKIIEFETGEKINIELLFLLADKFDVDINFNKFF